MRRQVLALAGLGLSLATTYSAWAGPTGGQVTTGAAQISQSTNTTTIQQSSQTLSVNWQSFDVGAQETVNFVQPNASSLAVNRVLSATGSEILGHLNANGQVWLINPNGVLFGEHAQVNVGGIVASTLDLVDGGSADTRKFRGDGNGAVVNQGTITAASGGYVALMGHQVSNQGVISAQLGTVALGAGSAQTLTFSGNRLLHLQVDESALNDLVENRKLIQANGGQVFMTAGAKDSVLASVVNNTGVVQAETVENHNGTITLLGGGAAGTVDIGGTLDTSAPHGGDAGSIETSGARVNIDGTARVDASASAGHSGTWLVDPDDLTIDTAAATAISTSLNLGTSVTEQTTSGAAIGVGQTTPGVGVGDINVNAQISWTNAAATLTLSAYHGINVNAQVSGAGQVIMTAAGGNLALGSSVTGQAGVTLSTGANFINNAGASAVSAGSGAHWLVYSTNPTLDTAGGLVPGFIQYNAPNGATPAASGSGFLYSVAPTLTVTALTSPVTKTYDGTTLATLAGSNITATGLLNGDTIASGTGSYGSPNAGSNINVTSPTDVATLAITNGSSIPVYGYALAASTVTAAVGTISPAQLTATIIGTPTKVYDGTTTATLSSANYGFSGFVSGQGASVSQPSSVSYDSTEAGNRTVNATFSSTNFTASGATNLANYVLPTSATGAGTITQALVNLTGLLANGKTYDGSNAASLNTSHAGIFGVITPDAGQVSLDMSGGSGTFASVNAGNDIAVTPVGFQLAGSKAADYQLVAPSDLTANISPKALSVSNVTATNKVYDGNTSDALGLTSAQLSGLVGIDTGHVSLVSGSATGTFGSPDAGSNIAITVSGFSLSGTAAGNYTVGQPAGLAANITQAPLTITLGGNPTKPYNGTTTAVVPGADFTLTGFVTGQSATVTQNALAQYASPNAGNNVGVTATLEASDFSTASGTSLSNYSFPRTVSGTGQINAIALSGYIGNNPTKTYDGSTSGAVTSSEYVLSGFVGSESATVNQPTATYAAPNAGPETISAAVTSANFTAGSGTLLSNYILPSSLSGPGTILPAQLGVGFINGSIVGNPTKTYDGTTDATLTAANFLLTGFVSGDGATVTQTVGQYATANVGKQNVTAQLTSGNFAAQGSTNLSNYTLPTVVYGAGTINPALLTATIIGDPTKVYDGSTSTALLSGNYQLFGFATGEGATVNPSSLINYSSKDVGLRTITAALTSSAYTADPGTLMSNYVLATSATGTGHITQAPLYVTGTSAANKIYDTTTAATLNVAGAGLAGLVTGEAGLVTLNTTTSGTFSQADVGNGLGVTATGFSISGTGASNYSLQPVSGLHANITPAPLTVSGVTADSRFYDATATGTLTTSGATLLGVLGSDNVTLSTAGSAGTFASVNAGTGIPVTASGFTLGGSKANDYALGQPTGLSADITPQPITAQITGNPIKPYDGSNSATLTALDYVLTGFIGTQNATVPQSATANYLSANAGTNIGLQSTLVISDFVAGAGTSLSNYSLPTTATGTLGAITPKILDLTGTRVYDTTTNAAGTLFGILNGLNGDALTVTGNGTLVSKNVGTENFSSLNTLSLSANGGSTLATNYTLIGGTDWVKITPAALTVANTSAADKTYDGNTTASLSGATLMGVLSSDAVTLGNDATGTFVNRNVGNRGVNTSMTISGTDAGNYSLTQPSGIAANITSKTITVAASGVNKVYDGNSNDAATLGSSGVVSGDAITFADTSASFTGPNVGTGIAVSVSGISASGADAGNYTLINSTAATAADITPKVLNLTGQRVYDANTDAVASLFGTAGVLNGVNGEQLTLSGTGTLSSKNVNSAQTFSSLSGFTLTGNGSALVTNYTLTGGTDWVKITPAALTVANTSAADKTYDGNTTASLSGATLMGVLSSDAVTLGNDATGTFVNRNVGNRGVNTSMTISGTDAGNYSLTQPSGIAANITSKTITVAASGVNKVYDGNSNDAATLGSSGVVSGDAITFADTSASFTGPNVGTGKTVSVGGISASGADAGNYTLSNSTATTAADITPAVLNLIGTRPYDQDTDAAASLFGTAGVLNGVNGEQLTLSGTGTLTGKNVNSAQTFSSLSGLTLTGNGSALATNYTFAGGTDKVNITSLSITVVATGADKVYDATRVDPGVTLASTGVFSGDTVVFADTSALFGDKNVGGSKTVSVAGISATGADAGNYTFSSSATTTAAITAKPITITATGANKTYDGSANDAVTLSSNAGGVISGDAISFSDASATFATPDVGGGKTVTVSGIAASGADKNNYSYNTGTTTTANISAAILNLIGTRPYDDNTDAAATLFGTTGVLTGVNGEQLTLTGTGTLTSKNVNSAQTFSSLSGFTLTGNGSAQASNYTFTGGTDKVDITPLSITVTATGADKVYDATRADPGVTLSSTGVFSGDTVLFADTSALFGDKNVGGSKVVTLTGITATGADAGNYSFNTGTAAIANITPAPLVVMGTQAGNKAYDGNTTALLSGATLSGVLTGDLVTLGNDTTGSFGDKNVGAGKTVTAAMSISGTDATNYSLTQPGGLSATITAKNIAVGAIGTNRVYDGSSNDQVTLSSNDLVSGDSVSFSDTSATFSDKNVGNGKTVSVSGINASGADAGNYSFNTNAATIASITPRPITVAATGADKVYDGNTSDTGATLASAGVLAGDALSFTGSSAVFDDKNVGTGKAVSVGGISASGADASNYSYNTTAATTATITPAMLAVTGTVAANRTYDGTVGDLLSGATLSGVLGSDTVTLGNDTIGTFGNKNIGTSKAVTAAMTISGTDAGDYVLIQPNGLAADITTKLLVVSATGANKVYDGNTSDEITLDSNGVITGDTVAFTSTSANFSSASVGNTKTVTVNGIQAIGSDAANYALASNTATTTADITTGAGIQDTAVCVGYLELSPNTIATPYGVAPSESPGQLTGNKKMLHRPVERNQSREDFKSGLSLQIVDGGVRMPAGGL